VFGIQSRAVLAKANEVKVKKKDAAGPTKKFTEQNGPDGHSEELLDKMNRPLHKVSISHVAAGRILGMSSMMLPLLFSVYFVVNCQHAYSACILNYCLSLTFCI
jgi:hypothetical protein